MSLEVTSSMEVRVRFVMEAELRAVSMTELCRSYGISRETGYAWRARYASGGFGALSDASRARLRQGSCISPSVLSSVLALRQQRPTWGPKKLRAFLRAEKPDICWPAASTIGDVLKRHDLVEVRRVRSRGVAQIRPYLPASEPNELWCIDFKGWFRTLDGQRCDPLTVSDAVSRYVLACKIVEPTTQGVWPACEQLFLEHGQPRALRMDNGPPFGSKGAAGLTRLSVMWVKLGIVLEPITPGVPQQNGRHERMHRVLKAETSKPPEADCAAQQLRFDRFRRDFNEIRPHEALGQRTPASIHRPNLRPYTGVMADPWYDADHRTHRVLGKGEIRWGGELLYISEALAGEVIGIAELPSGDRVARFADIDLGVIQRQSGKFLRFSAPRPDARPGDGTGGAEPQSSGLLSTM